MEVVKVYAEAVGYPAKGVPRNEPFHGVHAEDRIRVDDEHLALGERAYHGHQAPRPEERKRISDAGQLCARGRGGLLHGGVWFDLGLV
ncbi:MAG: hypothetical protein MZV64_17340 [Ignavibacteriales bacterium]|nr:hypothetical protein [Ignavibacteriales bacterium]